MRTNNFACTVYLYVTSFTKNAVLWYSGAKLYPYPCIMGHYPQYKKTCYVNLSQKL